MHEEFVVQSGEHPIATSSVNDVISAHIVFPDSYDAEPVVHATVKLDGHIEESYIATVCDTTGTGFTVLVRRYSDTPPQRGGRAVHKPWTNGIKVQWSARPFDDANGRVSVETSSRDKHSDTVLINVDLLAHFGHSLPHVIITPHTTSERYNDNITVQIKDITSNRLVALAKRVTPDGQPWNSLELNYSVFHPSDSNSATCKTAIVYAGENHNNTILRKMVQFTHPFDIVPIVIAVPRTDTHHVGDDTMVVNIQNVTHASFTAIIRKVTHDGNPLWDQNVQVSYSAHVPTIKHRHVMNSPVPHVVTTTRHISPPKHTIVRHVSPTKQVITTTRQISPLKHTVVTTRHTSPPKQYASPRQTTVTTTRHVSPPKHFHTPQQQVVTTTRYESPVRRNSSPPRIDRSHHPHMLSRTDNHSPLRTPRTNIEMLDASPRRQLTRVDQHSPQRGRPSPTVMRKIETAPQIRTFQTSPPKVVTTTTRYTSPTKHVITRHVTPPKQVAASMRYISPPKSPEETIVTMRYTSPPKQTITTTRYTSPPKQTVTTTSRYISPTKQVVTTTTQTSPPKQTTATTRHISPPKQTTVTTRYQHSPQKTVITTQYSPPSPGYSDTIVQPPQLYSPRAFNNAFNVPQQTVTTTTRYTSPPKRYTPSPPRYTTSYQSSPSMQTRYSSELDTSYPSLPESTVPSRYQSSPQPTSIRYLPEEEETIITTTTRYKSPPKLSRQSDTIRYTSPPKTRYSPPKSYSSPPQRSASPTRSPYPWSQPSPSRYPREAPYSPITGIERLSIEQENKARSSHDHVSSLRARLEALGTPEKSRFSPSHNTPSSPFVNTSTPSPSRAIIPVTYSAERQLIQKLGSEQYGSAQIEMIRTFLAHFSGTLSSAFLLEILGCVHMESNKVQAMQIIVDSLKYSLDGHDISRLLQTFTMTSRKRELLNMIFDKKVKPPLNLSIGASVQQILSQIPMDSHKIEALRLMGPYIIDSNSAAAHEVVNSFTQQLHRNQARTILGL